MKFGKGQINLRSEMAIWGALTAIALTLALTMISVVTITDHLERDSQDDVAILANDVAEAFDHRIPEIIAKMQPQDLLILTADHGNDPTWKGSDHTREQVPIMVFSPSLSRGEIGIRKTFADIGESAARWLGLPPGRHGRSFL